MNRRRFLLSLPPLALAACNRKAPPQEVVVYTSVDDVFARPIAELFQKQSGIVVKLVPDTEETKSTGLLNRLIAEKAKPVADVFWSGDPMRAAVLKSKGISQPHRSPNAAGMPPEFSDASGHWSALSARRPGTLSIGQQQRVALARAIAAQPHLLLLDEPFSSLDLALKAELLAEVRAQSDARKAAVFLVTHNPREARALCPAALMLEDSRVATNGPWDKLATDPGSRLLAAWRAAENEQAS